MDVLKVPELFKGNQLEEIKYWLDNESPFVDEHNWIKKEITILKVVTKSMSCIII